MGTSSSYGGPNGKNPLLPQDFGIKWSDLKAEMSQTITGRRRNSSGRIMKKYVSANGGTKELVNRSSSGIASFGKLIGFMNSINNEGIVNTLSQFKIDFQSDNISVAFSQLINKIAPEGSFKEEVVTRNAAIEAFSKLYELMEENNLPFDEPLSNYSEKFVLEVSKIFTIELILAQLMSDLGSSMEVYGEDTELVLRKEQEIRDYVSASVGVAIDSVGLSGNPNEVAEKIITMCFELFLEEGN